MSSDPSFSQSLQQTKFTLHPSLLNLTFFCFNMNNQIGSIPLKIFYIFFLNIILYYKWFALYLVIYSSTKQLLYTTDLTQILKVLVIR